MNELKNRGVEDILIAVVDGLKGFPDAIQAVYPDTTVQTCIVHLIRLSLDFVSWKDRKPVVAALKAIYRAVDAEAGAKALDAFEAGDWGRKLPGYRPKLAPRLGRSRAVLRLSRRGSSADLHHQSHRGAEFQTAPGGTHPGPLPTDEAALKLLFLVLNQTEKEWTMPAREWAIAKAQFAILFGERFTRAMA